MTIHLLTIFPKMFDAVLGESIIKRARANKHVDIQIHDLRKWTKNKHKTVDDKPYGGGAGMVMKIEPIYEAIQELKTENTKVIVLSAKGQTYTQQQAQHFATQQDLIIICPHYEGVDQRVLDHLIDYEVSIGDFVLTGGELPAMILVDSIVRLLPGVLGNPESLKDESHNTPGVLEYPQYTRPETFNNWSVPEVLLNGNHKEIENWKQKNAIQKAKLNS